MLSDLGERITCYAAYFIGEDFPREITRYHLRFTFLA